MPQADCPLVRLEAVTKRFSSGTEAVGPVSLCIRQGEFLSLLGPSGCGKSTLLRLVAGLIAPSSGAITWADGDGDHGRDIGFVFQEPTLMPWANVFDNVWLPLRLAGQSRAMARPAVEAMLAAMGLASFAQAYPVALSGGMKMRVAVARALVTKPKLLLMDEPFAALDEITRFRLNDDLLALHKSEGCTVIFVTHSVFESAYLSDRVAVMTARPGRITTIVAAPFATRDAALRTAPAYMALAAELSAHLKEAA